MPVVVASMSIRGDSPRPVERIQDVLAAGGTALEDNQRHIDEVGQRKIALAEERVARRGDEAPIEREEMAVFQARSALVGRGDAEREIGIAQERVLDVALGAGAQPDADVGKCAVEPPDRIEHGVEREVLRGRDVNLMRAFTSAEDAGEPAGPIEERDGVREKLFALGRERRTAARPALLVVERHRSWASSATRRLRTPCSVMFNSSAAARGFPHGPVPRARRPGPA